MPLFDVVAAALHPEAATACLLAVATGDGPDVERAWERFGHITGSLADFLRTDRHGVKRVLPLLEYNTRRLGLEVNRNAKAILRAAAVREQVRFQSFETHGRAGLEAIVASGLSPVVLKGVAAAFRDYPSPAFRHSHDIDMLVDPADLPRMGRALSEAGFSPSKKVAPAGSVVFIHRSGLPIACHSSPVGSAGSRSIRQSLISRSQPHTILGIPCRILAPGDSLAHACGHALHNPRRRSFSWLTDTLLLLRNPPGLWDSFLTAAETLRVELPALVVLTDLRNRFQVEVPVEVLERLQSKARTIRSADSSRIIRLVRKGGEPSLGQLFRSASWQSRWSIFRAFLSPNPYRSGFEESTADMLPDPGQDPSAMPPPLYAKSSIDRLSRFRRGPHRGAVRNTATPSWVPTLLQQRLLDACLLDDDAAAEAYRDWRSMANLEKLDVGSIRLLPLLWKRLDELGIDEPDRNRFKAGYRRTWCFNQLAIARGTELIGQFAAVGIPAMLLKGAALAMVHYGDLGLRPMDDLDIAVPRALAGRAAETLVKAGWRSGVTPLTGAMAAGVAATGGWIARPRPLSALDEAYFFTRHAHGFDGPVGLNIDLHWHLMQGQCDPGIDDAAWAESQAIHWNDVMVRVPSPAIHLLLLMSHASRWNAVPSIRWIADAVTVIRSAPGLDWERLASEAIVRRVSLQTSEMLEYIRSRFALEIPAGPIADLSAVRIGRAERTEYLVKTQGPGVRSGLQELRWLYGRYRAIHRHHPHHRSQGFPAFVRHVLDAPSLTQVVRYGAAEFLRRRHRAVDPQA